MKFDKINDVIYDTFSHVEENKSKIEDIKKDNGNVCKKMNSAIHNWLKKNDPEWEEEHSHFNYGTILTLMNEMGDDTDFEDVESFKEAIEEFYTHGLHYTVRFFTRDCEDVTEANFDGSEISFTAELDGSWVDGTITVRNGEVVVDTY